MANLSKEIHVEVPNKPGTLSRVTAPLKDAGVNITSLCGWGEKDKGMIMLITDNNSKALEALKKAGFQAREEEVVTATLPNQVGTLAGSADKLGRSEIDINYCYFTVNGNQATVVFSTKNNAKAKELLG